MGNQTEYFERIGYKPKYFLGDRIFGKWNGIPFVGTVGNDRVVSNDGPEITVLLDLPIVVDKNIHNVIIVKHKDIKRLVSMDDKEPLKLQEAGSIPVKRTNTRKKQNEAVPKSPAKRNKSK